MRQWNPSMLTVEGVPCDSGSVVAFLNKSFEGLEISSAAIIVRQGLQYFAEESVCWSIGTPMVVPEHLEGRLLGKSHYILEEFRTCLCEPQLGKLKLRRIDQFQLRLQENGFWKLFRKHANASDIVDTLAVEQHSDGMPYASVSLIVARSESTQRLFLGVAEQSLLLAMVNSLGTVIANRRQNIFYRNTDAFRVAAASMDDVSDASLLQYCITNTKSDDGHLYSFGKSESLLEGVDRAAPSWFPANGDNLLQFRKEMPHPTLKQLDGKNFLTVPASLEKPTHSKPLKVLTLYRDSPDPFSYLHVGLVTECVRSFYIAREKNSLVEMIQRLDSTLDPRVSSLANTSFQDAELDVGFRNNCDAIPLEYRLPYGLIRETLQSFRESLDCSTLTLRLLSVDHRLLVRTYSSPKCELFSDGSVIDMDNEKSVNVAVAKTGQWKYEKDTNSERAGYLESRASTRSELCFPVFANGRIAGTVNAETSVVEGFEGKQETMSILASMLGACLAELQTLGDQQALCYAAEFSINAHSMDNFTKKLASLKRSLERIGLNGGAEPLGDASSRDENRDSQFDPVKICLDEIEDIGVFLANKTASHQSVNRIVLPRVSAEQRVSLKAVLSESKLYSVFANPISTGGCFSIVGAPDDQLHIAGSVGEMASLALREVFSNAYNRNNIGDSYFSGNRVVVSFEEREIGGHSFHLVRVVSPVAPNTRMFSDVLERWRVSGVRVNMKDLYYRFPLVENAVYPEKDVGEGSEDRQYHIGAYLSGFIMRSNSGDIYVEQDEGEFATVVVIPFIGTKTSK